LTDAFDVNLDVRSEYFEAADFDERGYEALLNWLSAKYSGMKFDVVVALGANALRFANDYGRRLFPGAQMVFWRRKDGLKYWKSNSAVSGVFDSEMERNLMATVEFISKLQPDLRQLILISWASEVDLRWEAAARNAIRAYEGRFAASYLVAPKLEELQV